jgi:rRNA maturation endonuclease Nob1
MALFLERISPNNLLIRLNGQTPNVLSFQQLMLSEIREEFSHNLSQQVYMSDEAWTTVKNAMNETVALINLSAKDLSPDAPAIELSKKVFEIMMNKEVNPSDEALKVIKQEMRESFF